MFGHKFYLGFALTLHNLLPNPQKSEHNFAFVFCIAQCSNYCSTFDGRLELIFSFWPEALFVNVLSAGRNVHRPLQFSTIHYPLHYQPMHHGSIHSKEGKAQILLNLDQNHLKLFGIGEKLPKDSGKIVFFLGIFPK